MTIGKGVVTGLKIVAVCLLFAFCFAAGALVSGLDKIGQQAVASGAVAASPGAQQAGSSLPANAVKPQPGNFLGAFLIFAVCAGSVLSYLILRSSWHGWRLAGAIWVGMYGISTVATQVESVFFLSNKLPHGMITALFLQGAIAAALFSPLAVLLLGKWRASKAPVSPALARMGAPSAAWRLALIVGAFVFLYMFFGYYVAWQNPDLRQYYGGLEQSSFYAALKTNWVYNRSIYVLQVFRALLYAACLYPLIRMLRAARWEAALAMGLFLSVWTTVLLLPNPVMPPSVAHSHFWETLGFSLVFGALAGSLLSTPRPISQEQKEI
jgi:hypothetical protein